MDFWDSLTPQQAVLVAAAVGAAGAIFGAFLANLVGQLVSARSSSRRQWDDARHRSYAKAAESFFLLWDSYDSEGRLTVTPDRADARGTDFLAAYSSAALISASDGTSAALDRLLRAAQLLWNDPAADWPTTDRECHEARASFQTAARKEFGMRRFAPAPYSPLSLPSGGTGTSDPP